MGSKDDDSFRPRLGAPRTKGLASPRFISRVIKAASHAGPLRSTGARRRGTRPGAKLGRGHVAARLVGRQNRPGARRVTVKTRLVILKRAGAHSTTTHLRYLEREGVTPEGGPGRAYGQTLDEVDLKEFESRGRGDRHQFRFIVSAEDGAELGDLKGYTRELMGHMERDLGTRLDWVAVDHWDTGHPHTHIVLRGKDEKGRDLIIDREYIAHGMRSRAGEIVTRWLGARTQLEIEASLVREVDQERWTGLDRTLHEIFSQSGLVDLKRLSADARNPIHRAALVGRLRYLTTLGLAQETGAGIWRLSPGSQETLSAMGERGDIVRSLQRAMGGQHREHRVFDPERSEPVVGRVMAKGLHDELSDRGYIVVDGLDGRAHYAVLPTRMDLGRIPTGAVVEVRPVADRAVDQAIVSAARAGIYRTEEPGHQQRESSLNPNVTQATVRRLEALRRAHIVERVCDGVWRVPADLVAQGRAYDLKALGGAAVDVRCHLPLEKQTRAVGSTWLDQELVKGSPELPATDFGGEVRSALAARAEFLTDQGLARKSGQRLILQQDLLATLRDREIAAVAAKLETGTGLTHRPLVDGVRVSGTYRQSLQLVSGRFAMLHDGVGFSLVPWRPVIEHRLGQPMSAVIDRHRVDWELGRTRSPMR